MNVLAETDHDFGLEISEINVIANIYSTFALYRSKDNNISDEEVSFIKNHTKKDRFLKVEQPFWTKKFLVCCQFS